MFGLENITNGNMANYVLVLGAFVFLGMLLTLLNDFSKDENGKSMFGK